MPAHKSPLSAMRSAFQSDRMVNKIADVNHIMSEIPALFMSAVSIVIITVLITAFLVIVFAPLIAYPGGIEAAIAEFLARSFPGQAFGVAYASLFAGILIITNLLVMTGVLVLSYLDTPPATKYEIANEVAEELERRYPILSATPVTTQGGDDEQ